LGYRQAHCWAHVLRKFHDSEPNYPQSYWLLERIGELNATASVEQGEELL